MSKRLKLSDIIACGLITTPFKIHAKFKGHNFTAKIDKDGFIILEGKRYTSLSIAAGTIRAKISGKPKDGVSYRRANGWTFWKYTEGKKIISINELREKYHARR